MQLLGVLWRFQPLAGSAQQHRKLRKAAESYVMQFWAFFPAKKDSRSSPPATDFGPRWVAKGQQHLRAAGARGP
eukprot:9096858-Alexandrium_andersonii.AAC.1